MKLAQVRQLYIAQLLSALLPGGCLSIRCLGKYGTGQPLGGLGSGLLLQDFAGEARQLFRRFFVFTHDMYT
jgi:hypothetical protein